MQEMHFRRGAPRRAVDVEDRQDVAILALGSVGNRSKPRRHAIVPDMPSRQGALDHHIVGEQSEQVLFRPVVDRGRVPGHQ